MDAQYLTLSQITFTSVITHNNYNFLAQNKCHAMDYLQKLHRTPLPYLQLEQK